MIENSIFEGICNLKCAFREILVRRYANRLAFIQSTCESALAWSPALVYPPTFHLLSHIEACNWKEKGKKRQWLKNSPKESFPHSSHLEAQTQVTPFSFCKTESIGSGRAERKEPWSLASFRSQSFFTGERQESLDFPMHESYTSA